MHLSAKPFCAAAIYPVVSMRRGMAHAGSRSMLFGADGQRDQALRILRTKIFLPMRRLTSSCTPRTMTVVAVDNSLLLRAALKARGISVETHLFRKGGHGFGLRKALGKPVEAWPDLWRAWAGSIGLLDARQPARGHASWPGSAARR